MKSHLSKRATIQGLTDLNECLEEELELAEAEVDRLTDGILSIILRCEEGSPDTDWLPTIARIGREALLDVAGDDKEGGQ